MTETAASLAVADVLAELRPRLEYAERRLLQRLLDSRATDNDRLRLALDWKANYSTESNVEDTTVNEKTLAVWKFVARYNAEHEFPPSVRNIALGCGFGSTTAHRHLVKLEAAGIIRRESAGTSRAYRLLKQPKGEVAA